ncbi:hypothetical protein KR074_007656, partial [Drosophila pseudoananassae]
SKFDIRLESVESIKGDEETLFEFNPKLVGRDRALNGTFKTLVVFDESVMAHGRLYTFKNGDWVQSNFKIDMKGCDFFKSFVSPFYKTALEHFPSPICPLSVGEYPVINAKISTENWPNYMSPGLAKAEFFLEKDGKTVGGLRCQYILVENNI